MVRQDCLLCFGKKLYGLIFAGSKGKGKQPRGGATSPKGAANAKEAESSKSVSAAGRRGKGKVTCRASRRQMEIPPSISDDIE